MGACEARGLGPELIELLQGESERLQGLQGRLQGESERLQGLQGRGPAAAEPPSGG